MSSCNFIVRDKFPAFEGRSSADNRLNEIDESGEGKFLLTKLDAVESLKKNVVRNHDKI
jgi:hypothetical protein